MERIKLFALLGALGIAGTVACTATIGTPSGPIVDNSSSSGSTGDGGASSSSGNTGDGGGSSSSSGSTSSSSSSGAADSGPKDCAKQPVSFGTSATEVACGKCVNNACCAEFSACFATADSPCSKAYAKITSDKDGGCVGVPDNEYEQCVTDQKVVFCMADMACAKAVDDAIGCQDNALSGSCAASCPTGM
jgi:hypothetical protein